jgi:hypothetical protein
MSELRPKSEVNHGPVRALAFECGATAAGLTLKRAVWWTVDEEVFRLIARLITGEPVPG